MLPKRILILTADAGFGHRAAANAVAEAMLDRYGDSIVLDVVNPLEDKRTPLVLRDSQSDHDWIVRNSPELYRFGYDASDKMVTSAIFESALIVMLYEVLRDTIKIYQPDAILTTYPLFQAPLEAVFVMSNHSIPLLTSVTDLATVHRIWFHKGVDLCLTPTAIVENLALGYGLTPEQLKMTGIPVNPSVARERRSQADLRRELGWDPDLPTFLAVGSRRVSRLMDALNVFNHFGLPLQLAVVAGKDEDLYRELQQVEWHAPTHLYLYADNVPQMMLAADAVISKAGGLVVTETLACGRAMMLIDVNPGQETGNAEFVIESGAGDLARSDLEVLETLGHWMASGGELLRKRSAAAAAVGKPNAAVEAADLLWEAALRGPRPHRRQIGKRTLVDLFRRNQIEWQEIRRI